MLEFAGLCGMALVPAGVVFAPEMVGGVDLFTYNFALCEVQKNYFGTEGAEDGWCISDKGRNKTSDYTCANVKVDDSNSYSLSGENLSLCNAASPQTNSTKLINSVLEEIMVDTKAIPSLLISYGEYKIPGNVHVDNSEKNSLELHFDYEEHSSDSTIDIDHATGLEKVDLLGDDDSQYEDGEL
ncbi:hypothetical protein KSP39_PZI007427 [Platanthera zijinensis]|uniref:Uncharacterized protein n=1 Tax=Platanthera zijinensis TaxID=2320716 RepID=A0AAP0G9I2_9ASPA